MWSGGGKSGHECGRATVTEIWIRTRGGGSGTGGEITLVRVLAIKFIDEEDVGQAALDIEMAGLIER
jgi:uncharacterized protein (DUF2235 family)